MESTVQNERARAHEAHKTTLILILARLEIPDMDARKGKKNQGERMDTGAAALHFSRAGPESLEVPPYWVKVYSHFIPPKPLGSDSGFSPYVQIVQSHRQKKVRSYFLFTVP